MTRPGGLFVQSIKTTTAEVEYNSNAAKAVAAVISLLMG